MIPILYSSLTGAPITTGMGMGPLADCIECTCYEEINGEFECAFKYPYTGSLYPYIKKGAIVAAKPSPAYGNVFQQFKIYKIGKPINGIITVNAHHVSYELGGLPVAPFNFEGTTADVIMNELYDASLIADDRFTFSSELTKIISISSPVPKNLREILLGTDDSVVGISKNELLFNNYSVSLLEARGQSTEIEIIYGRELIDYRQEESIENAYSHLVAYAITKNTNGADMIVGTSPGAIQLIDPVSLGHQKCLIRDFTGEFDNPNDITQSNLAVKAAEYIENNNLSVPTINFRVSFVDLKKNPEYSNILTAFGNIGLGDNIKVLIQKLGVSAKARIIATTYDVLAEEFISVEVGERRDNVADTIYKLQKNNKTVARSVTSLQENNKHIADYIVEQGTTDIWTYRKWASGIAECWGRTSSSTKIEWDDMCVGVNVSLPFQFAGHPSINCSGHQQKTHSSYVAMAVCDSNVASAYIKCQHEPNEEYPCWFNFYVIGRYK